MASEELKAALAILADMRGDSGFMEDGFDIEKVRQFMRGAEVEAPEGATVEIVDAGGVAAEWVCDRDASPTARLVHFHGGGYVCGGPFSHRALAAALSEVSGCAVLVPDYRLGPEHPFPAAVQDGVTAYEWMRENGPGGAGECEHSYIGGDSAGGGLTLATMLALRDEGRPLPDAAYTISAYADLSHSGESVRTRAEVDPLIGPSILPAMASAYLDGADARNPLASPVFGDPRSFPPLLVQVGDAEILLDDSTRFAESARRAGVDVTLEVWPEMFHCWHTFAAMLPEGSEATQRIGEFLRSHR